MNRRDSMKGIAALVLASGTMGFTTTPTDARLAISDMIRQASALKETDPVQVGRELIRLYNKYPETYSEDVIDLIMLSMVMLMEAVYPRDAAAWREVYNVLPSYMGTS